MTGAAHGLRDAIDIAIVSYNTDAYLHRLLMSLSLVPRPAIREIHVWDNASDDATLAVLEAFGRDDRRLRVYRSASNVQHGPALDGLLRRHCGAPWVLVLDSDTEVIGDFLPHLPIRTEPPPAFVGQIHPQMPHLYAYLAHLLIHRPTYLTLPPFRDDGAPGVDLFRAIQTRQLPWARFRWCDFVSHAGQASLRALHARHETGHPLYRFAAQQVREAPTPATRAAEETRLRAGMHDWLARRRTAAAASPSATVEPAAAPPPAPQTEGPPAERHWRSILAAPTTMLSLRRARRIGLVQRRAEILRLYRIVRRLRPRRVLEIGTAYGGSLFLWTRAAARDAHLISVDLPPWELDDPWEPRRVAQFQAFARRRQRLDLIRGDSHAPATREAVGRALGSAPLDFLFIDGDHSYDGVTRDIADYGRLVRPGGLMALHDIHPHSQGWGGDVPRVWRNLRANRRGIEIIADPTSDGFGIGLLWM